MEVLNKIEKLKAELDSLRPIDREAEQRIMQKFRLDWNYHSNSLEGNSLTYGETKALILFGITAQGKPLKDHFEITGHDEAIKWIEEVGKEETPLTETFIRQLHTLILKEPYEVDAVTSDGKPTKKKIEIGKYKTTPNHVRTQTDETFYFASPEETPAKMGDLIEWFREKKYVADVHPIVLATEFHYKFILIHPFDDGNGRTARILMNFILMQHGYPPVIIKTEDKENYYSVLRQADAGILEPFIEYIAQNLVRSLETMIKGAKGESIEEPDDLDKELALLERRIRNVGEKIEITRNRQIQIELFDKSITPLANAFIESGRKFDRFYINKRFLIEIDGQTVLGEFDNAIYYAKQKLEQDNVEYYSSIKMLYIHQAINQGAFESFNFTSIISFQFELTKYKIFYQNDLLCEKLYSVQLTNSEIDYITNLQAKKHKEFIESKLKELEEKEKTQNEFQNEFDELQSEEKQR